MLKVDATGTGVAGFASAPLVPEGPATGTAGVADVGAGVAEAEAALPVLSTLNFGLGGGFFLPRSLVSFATYIPSK